MKNERIVLRINQLMQYFRLNQTEMAAKLGMGQANLSGTLNGKRPCGDGIINKVLISFPDINREWLLYGEGEMLKSTPAVQQNNVNGNNNYIGGNRYGQCPECGGSIPVIEAENVGVPIIPTALSRQPNIDILEVLSRPNVNAERSTITAGGVAIDLWHKIRDTSLMPNYRTGDMLGLWSYPKGEENPIPGKLYAVDTWSNGLIVRYLFPNEVGYRAHSPNTEEYPDFNIKSSDIIRIYRIMIMVRM